MYIYSWLASHAVEYGVNAFCIHIYKYAKERRIGKNNAKNQIFFHFQKFLEVKFHSHEAIHSLYLPNISQIISHRIQRFFLSYRIINPNQRKSNQLTIQYNNQIHIKIWTIITKLQNHIQKLKNISCQRNWLNFTHFLSIQHQRAENQRIKYTHKLTSNIVLKIVITFQNQMGSHLILPWMSPKIQAHIMNHIIRFLIFNLELTNKYKTGNNQAHAKAEIKTHRFCHDESIQK